MDPFPRNHPAAKPKLLDQVRSELRKRHYSHRTEEAYISWIRRFICFHKVRHPSSMGRPEVEAFLSFLATDRNVAASTQNQASGLCCSFTGAFCGPAWTGWTTWCGRKSRNACPSSSHTGKSWTSSGISTGRTGSRQCSCAARGCAFSNASACG